MCLQPIDLSFALTPSFSSSDINTMHLPCLLPPKLPGVSLPLLPASAAKVALVAGSAG